MATATLTRPTNAASQAGEPENLPRANVRRAGDFPANDFENIANVPVFVEHETTTRAGDAIKFGRDELSAIVDRCNRRIEQRHDYAAITIGHTPDPEAAAKGAPMPEVIGFAGPFRLGMIGEGAHKSFAILADFHIYREDLGKLRKHPRRSPEVWLEDRFEEMFLDPIALLGAEAPRLDMGLLYSAVRNGRQVEKYAAVAAGMPSPASVFTPSTGAEKPAAEKPTAEKHRYAEGDSGFSDAVPVQKPAQETRAREGSSMLAPEEVEQIADAIERLPWVGWVKQKMQQEAAPGPGAMTPGAVADPGAGGEAGPAPAGEGDERRTSPTAPSPRPEIKKDAADAGASAKVDYPSAPAKCAAGEDDELDSELEEDEREREEYARMQAKYGADEDVQRYMGLAKKYAAGSADGKGTPKPAEGQVDEGNNRPGEGSAAGPTADGAEPYRRSEGRERYAIDARVLRLERENKALQTRLADQERRASDTERYARLQDLRHRFAFDLDNTFEQAKYGRMSAEQFDAQCEFIERNCREIPIGSFLPDEAQLDGVSAALATHPPGRSGSPERYQKAHSDQARQICDDAIAAGKSPNYERVLADVKAGRQPVI